MAHDKETPGIIADVRGKNQIAPKLMDREGPVVTGLVNAFAAAMLSLGLRVVITFQSTKQDDGPRPDCLKTSTVSTFEGDDFEIVIQDLAAALANRGPEAG